MTIKSPETFQYTEAFDDEIDLKELFTLLWNGKLVITLITGFAAVCAVLFALSLPNIYESKALLAPKGESGAGGLAGLARQYGGLASLAGINIGGGGGESSKSMRAQQKIQSLDFFTRHLYEKIVIDLMAVDHWDAASGALVIDPDVFDVKSDVIKTLVELGIQQKDLFVSDNTKHCYHPGRSGSINLKSEKGPHLAYFGELHPALIKNLDFQEKNIFGFEIFLKNIPEPNKKIRQTILF